MNILITGATSGIGKSLAIEYAKLNHKVFAVGRNIDVLIDLNIHNIIPLRADVTDIDQLYSILPQINSQVNHLDLIILNAGNCEYIDIEQFKSSIFRSLIEVNFLGNTNCLEVFLPLLKKSTSKAQLVSICSMAFYLPLSRAEAYGASKAATNYLFESLAIDLRPYNIDVTIVNPGFVKTPLTDRNDFKMPTLISVDSAVIKIMNGIKKRKAEVYFPLSLGLPIKILSLLPRTWWRKLGMIFKK